MALFLKDPHLSANIHQKSSHLEYLLGKGNLICFVDEFHFDIFVAFVVFHAMSIVASWLGQNHVHLEVGQFLSTFHLDLVASPDECLCELLFVFLSQFQMSAECDFGIVTLFSLAPANMSEERSRWRLCGGCKYFFMVCLFDIFCCLT